LSNSVGNFFPVHFSVPSGEKGNKGPINTAFSLAIGADKNFFGMIIQYCENKVHSHAFS
jgi:hypothetical protein